MNTLVCDHERVAVAALARDVVPGRAEAAALAADARRTAELLAAAEDAVEVAATVRRLAVVGMHDLHELVVVGARQRHLVAVAFLRRLHLQWVW